MNKTLLMLIMILGLGSMLYAQDLAIYDLEGNDITGDTLYLNEMHNGEIVFESKVMNNSGSDLDIKFKKSHIDVQVGAVEYFCVGLSCFLPSAFVSGAFAVPANSMQTDTTWCHFNPMTTTLPSMLLYTYFNAANAADSVSVWVVFEPVNTVESYIGIDNVSLNVYPNPTTDYINIDFNQINSSDTYFSIYNMLGTEVRNINLDGVSGSINVSVNDLTPGIYFYGLEVNGRLTKTNRLIVK